MAAQDSCFPALMPNTHCSIPGDILWGNCNLKLVIKARNPPIKCFTRVGSDIFFTVDKQLVLPPCCAALLFENKIHFLFNRNQAKI